MTVPPSPAAVNYTVDCCDRLIVTRKEKADDSPDLKALTGITFQKGPQGVNYTVEGDDTWKIYQPSWAPGFWVILHK